VPEKEIGKCGKRGQSWEAPIQIYQIPEIDGINIGEID